MVTKETVYGNTEFQGGEAKHRASNDTEFSNPELLNTGLDHTVSKSKGKDNDKPVFDEQTLGKLLEAAYVVQEHNHEERKRELNLEFTREFESAEARQTKSPAPRPAVVNAQVVKTQEEAASADNSVQALAPIVETQQQIQARHLELEPALALIAERAAAITKAGGAAILLIQNHQGQNHKDRDAEAVCRAASGSHAPALGDAMALNQSLSSSCLRSGDVVRCADVNADFLLDLEQCQRRGITALIAVPIYHDGQIAGALEVYFSRANSFAEAQVHATQLMAGLAAEALARDAQRSMKKSLAAERASMLDALEKLQPNLAALAETSLANLSSSDRVSHDRPTGDPSAAGYAAGRGQEAKNQPVVPASLSADAVGCRKCGHEMMEQEQFCGKCGSPRSGDYEAPSMQTKVAALWLMQQVNQDNAHLDHADKNQADSNGARHDSRPEPIAAAPNSASIARAAAAPQGSTPAGNGKSESSNAVPDAPAANSSQPSPSPDFSLQNFTLQELGLPEMRMFAKPETLDAHAAAKIDGAVQPTADEPLANEPFPELHDSSGLQNHPLDDARLLAANLHEEPPAASGTLKKYLRYASLHEATKAPAIHDDSDQDNSGEAPLQQGHIAEDFSGSENEELVSQHPELAAQSEEEENSDPDHALIKAGGMTWTSAANARDFLQQMAGSRKPSSLSRFWKARRGDIYLAVAVLLVAGVIRWGIWSNHSVSANHTGPAPAGAQTHTEPTPDADLTPFDKILISVGLADPPAAPEDRGNPEVKVWIDSQSALYYCPGEDLYGKTPKGKFTSQRDAQLDQYEPAARKPCN